MTLTTAEPRPETAATPLRLNAASVDSIDVGTATVLDDGTTRLTLSIGPIAVEVHADKGGEVIAALDRLHSRLLEAVVESEDDYRTRTGHRCACGIWLDRDDPSCGSVGCELEMGILP